MNKVAFLFLSLLLPYTLQAQISRLTENIQFRFSADGTTGGGDNAPFWFTNNRYGLFSTQNNGGLVCAALFRTTENDSLRTWRCGYEIDLASPINKNNGYFCVQQAYVDVEWKNLRLSIGQKERVSELKNPYLSSGGLTLGMNARPLPQIRLELPCFWIVPKTNGLLALKGHLAYGWYTDGKWQRNFNAGTDNIYTCGSMFHSKAIFVRLGNKNQFPLEITGGWEMACQFSGTGWNIHPYASSVLLQDVKLGGNIFSALVSAGGDINDENYPNAAGNHIGSWHMRLDWYAKKWMLGLYMEHLFEDHSQKFTQYGWNDMLLGFELNIPKNPYLTTILYEYNTTMDQSGPIYHDKTQENPEQISARDDYYNNHIYGAWQMGGFVMGNPLIISPIYNSYFKSEGLIGTLHNRIQAHHVGLKGQPSSQWAWRVLYTHQRSLGTYNRPTIEPQTANYILVETSYSPKWCRGLTFTASYGHNDGTLLGKSNAAMLGISFSGYLH